jgi:hypothetical protein
MMLGLLKRKTLDKCLASSTTAISPPKVYLGVEEI